MIINIPPHIILESTVIYGIVHLIWYCIKTIFNWLQHELREEVRQERNRIINRHVKTGHDSRLKHCLDSECSSLQNLEPRSPITVLDIPAGL